MDTQEFDPNTLINPSSGLFARNPSHASVAETAEDQADIVKAIKGAGRQREILHLEYKDKENLPMMPGILKIRGMSEEQLEGFCKNLMRSKPNIFRVYLKLGDYPSAKEINNNNIQQMGSNKQRMHTDVGLAISKVLADQTNNIVELNYLVTNSEPGQFNSVGRAAATTEEEYQNDEFFQPEIIIEFFPNS